MKIKNIILAVFALGLIISVSSCKEDDPMPAPMAAVTFSPAFNVANVDGDVTGNGGNVTKAYTWKNSSTTAGYDMDFTSVKGGTYNLTVADADGSIVINQTLVSGQGDDTRGGVSAIGAPGDWSVTVTLTNFSGDGSFSLSQGD